MILPASAQARAAWFAAVGLPFSSADLDHARAYLDALGYAHDIPIQRVGGWTEAERIIRDPDWDRAWWQREDQERDLLMEQTRARLGDSALLERLSAATELAAEAIQTAATTAAAREAGTDAALIRAAAGAGAMALHEAALARLAQCGPDHLFMRKYRLLESGRWPLGVLRGVFHLF